MTANRETYLSVSEAAYVLGVEESTVHRMIRHGLLPRYRLRERYIRVRTADVEELRSVPREWLMRC